MPRTCGGGRGWHRWRTPGTRRPTMRCRGTGHGRVDDVVGGEAHAFGGAGGTALAHAHRLRTTGRTRGEEEEVELVGARVVPCRAGNRGSQGFQPPDVGLVVRHEQSARFQTQIEPGEQRDPVGIGDDQLAVGAADVLGQFVAPVGGVDADDHSAGQRGPRQQEEVLGGVLHQHADVERTGLSQGAEQFGPEFGLGHHRAPAPPLGLEYQSGAIVLAPSADQLGRGGEFVSRQLRRSAKRSRTGLSSMGSIGGSPASRRR